MDKSHPSYSGTQPQPAGNYPHTKPGYPPIQSEFVLPEVPYNPPTYGWCEDTQRNKPQSNTLAAATFIFASGGMSLAWSVGFAPSYIYMSEGARTHMQICWFVAVIIGAFTATFLVNILTKKIFNLIASLLVLINGTLFLAASESIPAVVIARYCDGIAFGLTIIPAIMAGSEQSVKQLRGLVLCIEAVGLNLGITLKTIYIVFWDKYWDFNVNQMHGALALAFGAIALLCSVFLTIESPTYYLRSGQENEALNSLRRLQKPHTVTPETYALLNQNKRLLEEDNARGLSENISLGMVPIAKLSIFRILVSMSFSLPLTWGIIVSGSIVNNSEYLWPVFFYGTMRTLGTTISIFTLDSVGRKIPTGVSMLMGGGIIIGTSSIFSTNKNLFTSGLMETAMGLLLAYQLLAGLASPASTTYLGEAFSISVKPYFILAAVFCENIVQIIIGCTFTSTTSSFSSFGFALGSLQLAFGVFLFIALPETKKTTLREALQRFKRVLYISR